MTFTLVGFIKKEGIEEKSKRIIIDFLAQCAQVKTLKMKFSSFHRRGKLKIMLIKL